MKVAFTNPSPVPHNLVVASMADGPVGIIPAFTGGTKTLTLKLRAGWRYVYYSTAGSHRPVGARGTLVVR